MFDTPHNHKCPECNCIWHHDPKAIPDDHTAHTVAHSCPKCGAQQYQKLSTGKPEFCSNGVRCIKLDGSAEVCIPAPTKPLTYAQREEIERRDNIFSLFAALVSNFEQEQGQIR